MPLSAAQIVTLACQTAKCPGFTAQAGQQLNAILQSLAQDYDFDAAKGLFTFNFVTDNGSGNGSGPYPLPADYLRADVDDVWYTISGVPYKLIPIDLSEYDSAVQQPGIANYPYWWVTDMSQSPPVAYVYPPASGSYPVSVRYRRQMPDIATPETSATVPWFPNQNYLIVRLSGEMMRITGDDRWQAFLSDAEGSEGAGDLLRKYLRLKDDSTNRSKRVTLDRRRFGQAAANLPNTKLIGW